MIFVTGCARSGTSLTTHILQAHGFNLGSDVNSLWENTDIRENVLKPYLASVGADPRGQSRLPDTDNLPSQPDLRGAVLERFQKEPWAYKDAKLTLVWPVWAKAFPEAKWVIVRRDKHDIADSCIRSGFMSHFKTHEGWHGWVEEHEKRFEKMKAALDAIEVWPRDFIADPNAFAQVTDHCGVPFERAKVTRCIDRNMFLTA